MEQFQLDNLFLIHCDEEEHTNEVHHRIAKEILDIKPNIIIFEFPRRKKTFFMDLNKLGTKDKDKNILSKIREGNKQATGDFNVIFDSIEKIWFKMNQQVFLFEFDGPIELTSNLAKFEYGMTTECLVWNYLRDKHMAQFLLENKEFLSNKKVVVLCHNFHWNNIKFLISNPSGEEVWKYYFVEMAKQFDLKFQNKEDLIKYLENKKRSILLKYWNIISDFR